MTQEQLEFLKSLHKIKQYCADTPCEKCIFSKDDRQSNYCLFVDSHDAPCDWSIKEIEEIKEKRFTLLK